MTNAALIINEALTDGRLQPQDAERVMRRADVYLREDEGELTPEAFQDWVENAISPSVRHTSFQFSPRLPRPIPYSKLCKSRKRARKHITKLGSRYFCGVCKTMQRVTELHFRCDIGSPRRATLFTLACGHTRGTVLPCKAGTVSIETMETGDGQRAFPRLGMARRSRLS